MVKLPKQLFCSNCGTALPKDLINSLVLGEIAYCEGCGQKFQLKITSVESEAKRKPLIDWEKTGVDLQQNMEKLGRNIEKVTKEVVRKSIKTAKKVGKEVKKFGEEVKKFIEDE
ncbi:hypothetical protein DSAG12_00887 [Promethearchaeum syntrophicum]|uniref:Uncharacterized protein n=1 Tax=Promethearchaeum syntrophicum TaxID=2594042 RepID=A0A5B9D7F8_9ARCH|nr:hypothetical protein [Candidatus Prometheoarchaeum syntrophicum]QEE15064.1 hypothetical protein DSAG12_00887 [Candidatus Prometheoarchaeum syntrophicum]